MGLLSGVGVDESFYGLTVVSETTHPFYWILVGALGLALLVGIVVRRIDRPWVRTSSVALTAAITPALVLSYIQLGSA